MIVFALGASVIIQKVKNLFFCVVFLASIFSLEAVEERGVGLRFNLSQEAEPALVDFFWKHREALGESLWIENYPTSDVKFSLTGCAVLVWKPMLGYSQHDENRIHCEVSFTWFDGTKTRYTESKIVYSLGREVLKADSFSENPSFSFQGNAASKLFETLEKIYAAGEQKYIEKAKNIDGEDLYYFSSADETRPMLMCQDSSHAPLCSFTWPLVTIFESRLDLGENSDTFLMALCSYGIKPDKGECPAFLSKPLNVECDYVGASVPIGTWGAVTDRARFECSYKAADLKKMAEFNLSSLVVRPHGGRYSPTIGIEMKGPRMGLIYKALKSYGERNIRGDSILDKDFPVNVTSLGGRPPWNMTYVSLRRARDPQEALVSLDCSSRTAGEDAYYYTPEKYDSGLIQYSCTLSRPVLRAR